MTEEAAVEKKKTYEAPILPVFLVIGAMVTLLSFHIAQSPARESAYTDPDLEPVFSYDIRKDYESGRIGKDAAKSMMEEHLKGLELTERITSWKSTGDKYLVTLKSGTVISYSFK